MSRTLLSRLGAVAVATALVAGGSLLVAAPAMAAEPNTITVANTAFQSGAGWGEGLTVSGTDFPVATEVTVIAGYDNGTAGDSYGKTTVTTTETGTFTTTFVPEFGPTDVREGFTAYVGASYADPQAADEVIFSNLVELQIAPFVPVAAATTLVPTCLSGTEAATTGVSYSATGYGQFEENVTYSMKDSAGTVVKNGLFELADETGTVGGTITVFSTVDGVQSGPIADGVYTITTTGSVVSAASFTVGDCTAPAAVPVVVTPAQLANTGSSDAGILVGGSALLLLVGAALMVARRRQNATA